MNLRLFTLLCCSVLWTGVYAQVSADFTASSTADCSPLIVGFTDISTGSPSSWSWNFGNGNTSTQQNPSAVYSVPGIYTVTLVAFDGSGGSDTMTKVNYIEVYSQPTPAFTSDVTSGCVPLTVNFSNNTIPGSIGIQTYTWDFGDGNFSNAVNPTHTYTTTGNYNVILIAVDSNGCQDQITQPGYVTVSTPPTADFSSINNTGCAAPQTVTFSNLSTGASALTYKWFFGDGDSSTVDNPSHTYMSFGTFDVTLVAADAFGCSDTFVSTNHVVLSNLTADFSADSITSCEGYAVAFTDLTSPSTLTPQSWLWDFGDGNTSTLQNPVHTYASAGVYTVSLQATFGGCTHTEVKNNYITINPTPVSGFNMSSTTGCSVPMTINFTDMSTGAVSWLWDFGDGDTSTLQNPSHTYTTYGSFDVSLTVTSGAGCQDVLTVNGAMQIVQPRALIGGITSAGCIPLTVNFMDSSQSIQPITNWFWDFGDGNTSTLQNPTHVYTTQGDFTVTLAIENSAGCRDTIILVDAVETGTVPVVDFVANPTSTCLFTNISFTNLTAVGTAWNWDFGDGGSTQVENPSYQYSDTGFYSVTLSVTNNGCTSDSTFVDYVYISPPDAVFTPTYSCTNPLEVTFVDNSIAPDIWIWDFGTGDSAFVQNPVYVFPDTGTYTVSLYVEDTVNGCSDIETQTISLIYTSVDFVADNTTGCRAHTANFTDLSVGAAAWSWDFDNGTTSTAQNPTVTFGPAGLYDVTLAITDVYGCIKTKTVSDYIIATGPTSAFTASVRVGCAPLTVDFTDVSANFIGNIISWSWFFGDGGTSSAQHPTYTYNNPGTYNVSLVVTDDMGCSSTNTQSNYIRTTFPSIDFTVDTLTCPGSPLNFTNLSTGSALSYYWDFGDGNTSTQTNPTHTYISGGQYTILLAATDGNGCTDTLVRPNHVTVEIPVADFSADSIFSSCPPLFANFSDSSTGDIVSWLWDFGDGSSSTVQNPSKIYTSAGAFDVTLIVTSREGCMDTIVKPSYANVLGPSGTFTFDPAAGCINLPVTFYGVTSNSVTNTWDFGDGTVLVGGDTMVHNYSAAGTYFPSLILQDASGCTVIETSSDSISSGGQSVDFTASPSHVCIPNTVNFTDLTSSIPSVVSWNWDFGDGATSTLQNPSHWYNTPGNYDVTLIVDNGICRDTLTQYQMIDADPGPTADFSMSDSVGCVPLTVNFTDQTTSDSAVAGVSWSFGDGNTSPAANPSHTYTTSGTYTVQLIVTSVAGCNDTVTRTIVINDLPVVSTSADTSICASDSVQLYASGGLSYEWTPTTGLSNSSIANPLAFPPATTTYYVQVTDANGCVASDSVIVSLNALPSANAGPDQTICAGDSVSITASGTGSSIRWMPSAGLSSDTILNPIAFPVISTNYLLSVRDSNGCTAVDVMTVMVNSLPPVDAGNDTFVCGGNSLQLNVTGANTYSWSPATYLDNPAIANPVTTPLTNISYVVSGTSTDGCISTDTLNIQFVQPPDANAGPDQAICLGSAVQLISAGGDPSDSYNWSPGSGISNTTVADPFASPTVTTTYILTITDTFGCSNTDDVLVTVNPPPMVTISPDTAICIGDSIGLTVSGGISYTWGPSPFLSCTNCQNPQAYPTATTTFSVDVTDSNACVNTASVTISVNPLPTGINNNDVTVCIGDPVALTTDAGISHAWTPSSGLSCSSCPNPVATPSDTTQYFVTITNSNGCTSTDSVTISIVQLPVPTVNADGQICSGDSYQLIAGGGTNYQWTPAAGLSCATCDTTVATPNATTTYVAEVQNAFGCSAYDSVRIIVQPIPLIDAGADIKACPGEAVQLNGFSDASSNFWTPSVFLNNPTIVDPVATPIDTTVFVLTGTNTFGCTSTDTVIVNILDKVQAIVSSDTTICMGESLQLNTTVLEASDIGYNVIWRPGFFLDDNVSESPVTTPLETITYTLIASSSTCIPDTQSVRVSVNQLPLVDAGEDQIVTSGAPVTLSATANSNYTYSWYPTEGLTCATCQSTDVTLNETEYFTATVTDQNGCSNSDSVRITVIGDCGEDLVFVPNVFTPNRDNINDFARVRTIGIDEINFFRIFDRWGKMIFETNDINEGWDGTSYGTTASSGVYVYYLSVNCTNNTEITKHGNITLIR